SAKSITDKAQDLFTAINLETDVSNLTVNHLESIAKLGTQSVPVGLLEWCMCPVLVSWGLGAGHRLSLFPDGKLKVSINRP
ncbi:hypothetical protein LCGC14_2893350, partial [marine sediment metagenome]